jgi:hypothetical protein
MDLVHRNHMVQQFAAAAPHPTLGNTVLPRTTNGGPDSLDIHGANCGRNFGAVLGVVIQDEKLGCWFVGKGFAQLLHDPGPSRMACNEITGQTRSKNAKGIRASDSFVFGLVVSPLKLWIKDEIAPKRMAYTEHYSRLSSLTNWVFGGQAAPKAWPGRNSAKWNSATW